MLLAGYVWLQTQGTVFDGSEGLDWLRGAVWPVLGLVLTVGIIDFAAPPVSTRSVSRVFLVLTCVASIFYFLMLLGVAVLAGNQGGASTLEASRPLIEWLSAIPTALVRLFFVLGETTPKSTEPQAA